MSTESRLVVSPVVASAAILGVLLIGAAGMYLVMRDRASGPAQTMNMSGGDTSAPAPSAPLEGPGASLPDVVVTLTENAVTRAGIIVAPVSTEAMTSELRLPGVVEPNAYRQVSVTPLVGGRVLRVAAQLGDRVRRGQSLAQVYSPELAEARTKYVAARAMLEAHDRELQRTQKLVDIGAASRQELERIHAEHAAQTAEVESARSRLQLLGAVDLSDGAASDREVGATANVPAPLDGVVTERLANVGLNVDPATKLFTVVDLSSVWIIADVYERDLHRVREADRVTVTPAAYPDRSLHGRVGYIDPQLGTETRTAKVRVEVANAGGELRLGMYADVVIATAGAAAGLVVPRSAVQHVGDRQVVYLPRPNAPATFVEREVRLGQATGELVEVVSGVQSSDVVVSEGSFFLRAEVERLGLRASPGAAPLEPHRKH